MVKQRTVWLNRGFVCNIFLTAHDAWIHSVNHQLKRPTCNLRRELFQRFGYISMHRYINGGMVKCGICQEVFLGGIFLNHIKTHDGHVCDVCNLEFRTPARLEEHQKVHSDQKPFPCRYCGVPFSTKGGVRQHEKDSHRNYQAFECTECGKRFNKKYTLMVHRRSHTGDLPFKCSVPGCLKAYPQKVQLKNHMTNYH